MELTKIADVLDAMADYVEANESEKQAQVNAAKESLIVSIGEKYAAATGETISDDLLKKFSGADVPLLEAMEKVAETKKDTDQMTMGEPSEKRDFSAEPENKKEAAEIAGDRFLQWIIE
jgi:hypothetical protein